MTHSQQLIDIHSDGHVHTRMCRHATGEMEEYVCAAIDRGLREIVFLEHLEAGISYNERTWLSEEDFDYYFSEGERLRQKYADRIRIALGVELGYNPEYADELLARLAARPWERVGLSCHFLPIATMADTGQHLNLLSRRQQNIDIARQVGVEGLLNDYFNTLIEAVRTIPATVVCHLDAALRYVPDLRLTAHHLGRIDTLLAVVEQKGMAVEVNTSGFAIRNEPFPARQILAMVLARNIPLIAGSDAHRPEDVARFFSTLPDYIKNCSPGKARS